MRSIFLTTLTCICLTGIAQNSSLKTYKLQGNISYDQQSPIEYAHVFIYSFDDSILSYGFTDSLGNYQLDFATDMDSIVLNVSRLGYKPERILLASNIGSWNVAMQLSKDSKLMEVVITDNQHIKVRGDTLSYYIQPFIDGSESSVEDILAKLPGISVDKNTGTIKYQGKEIKKILLDGDDLSGNNYKVLSKNLSADWIEEIEILKRFTDSRLLQGIQQSNEIAINLRIKEETKAPLFGTVEVGLGSNSKYIGKAELLSYIKKLKLFALVEANNTGDELEVYDLETYSNIQFQYKGFILSDPILANQLIPPTLFSQEKFTFHQGQRFLNSMVINPSNQTTIRSTSTIYNNQLAYHFTDSLFYFLPNQNSFLYTQQQIQKQYPFEIFQDLKFNYQLSNHEDVIFRLKLKHNANQLNSINLMKLSSIEDVSMTESNELFGSISYINKLNKNWVATTDVEIGFDKLNEKFNLKTREISTDSIQQIVKQNFSNIGLFSRIDGVLAKGFYTNLFIGVSQTNANLIFKFHKSEDTSLRSILNDYKFTQLFGEFQLEKHVKSTKLSATSRIRGVAIGLNNNSNTQLLFEPSLSISTHKSFYDILETKVKVLYNTEYVFLKPYQLFNTPLLTNFRFSTSYLSEPDIPIRNDIVAITIKATENQESFLSGNIEWVYLTSDQVLVSDYIFSENIVQSRQIQGGKSHDFLSKYSLDKYFSMARSTIKLAYEYGSKTSPLFIEGVSMKNMRKQSTISITSGTSLTKKVNFSLAYKIQETINSWGNEKNEFYFENYFAKLNVIPNQNFRMTISSWIVNFHTTNTPKSYLLDATFRFKHKDKKLELTLDVRNILNNKSVVINNIESSIFSSSNYPLFPRCIIIFAKYSF